ncbi:MAG: glycosyltransferase, partial [Pseudomonadota bacterium]
NGIRFDWPVRTDQTRAESVARLALASEARHYVSVGRMGGEDVGTAAKAHDVMIRAWREAGAGARRAHLHLLGDGELRPALEALAGDDQSIHFHGVVSGVHDWLVGADAFLMPSRHEGLPIAGIEALATGLPCLFSTIPPLRELEPASVRWVAPNDVSGLSAQLLESIDAPREYLPDAAAAVREAYGITAVARRYIDCYTRHGAEHFSRGVAT